MTDEGVSPLLELVSLRVGSILAEPLVTEVSGGVNPLLDLVSMRVGSTVAEPSDEEV